MTAALLARRDEEQRRGVNINIRAPEQTRALIDSAAKVVGKTRTEFMLDSARRCAEDILLDQRLFVLDDQKYDEFMKLLEQPAPPSSALKKLLAKKAPWEL